jgi:cyclohexanone monooxygenase
MATGNLTAVNTPPFPGARDYQGEILHTARWPTEGFDYTGRGIGVVGTGSSGVQLIPVVARAAAHVTVFQRTANFSMPARNHRMTPEDLTAIRADYGSRREVSRHSFTGLPTPPPTRSALEVSEDERRKAFDRGWEAGGPHAVLGQFTNMIIDLESNTYGADYARERIRRIVRDPEVAERLCPKDLPLGAKRICLDTEYYETYNRPTVELVDVREAPIVGFTADGLQTADGRRHQLDCIVFATGFDAMTGALLAIDVRGRGGLSLSEAWRAGPATYLGLGVAGLPNLFIVAGPGSPSVLVNMVLAVEQHIDWIADCIAHLDANQIAAIEPSQEAQEQWVAHVNEEASRSLRNAGNSWYRGVNVPGKPVVFMPYVAGLGPYRTICDSVAADGYAGFELSGARVAA